ncbi:MAG TPA: cyclase [Nitrospirota bacterium]|nr:cyclase [Nitrospirota bacterium]
MLSYILVRHKVRDYSVWKRAYDAHLPKRIEAGLTEKHLFRGANETNEVIILFEAKDLGRAKAFAESPDLRETMEKAGVIDKPDIYFLHDQAGAFAKASGY